MFDDATTGQEQAERGVRSVVAYGEGARQRGTMTHEKWKVGCKLAYSRCGQEEAVGDGSKRVLDDACTGSAAGRALAHASGNPNQLWQDDRYIEADFIVKGGNFLQASRVPAFMLVEGHIRREVFDERQGEASRGAEEGRHAMPWERDPECLYLPHLARRRP